MPPDDTRRTRDADIDLAAWQNQFHRVWSIGYVDSVSSGRTIYASARTIIIGERAQAHADRPLGLMGTLMVCYATIVAFGLFRALDL